MDTVYFATTNKGKVTSLQNRLDKLNINVEQINFELIEPQADTCKEISEIKAKQAFDKLKKPVLVDDSAFHIPVLNGFPGPYVKYVLKTLGGRGILNTASKITNRYAFFESSLTYMWNGYTSKSFYGKSTEGHLTNEFVEANKPEAWSEAWNIFIPKGSSKVLAHLSNEEIKVIKQKSNQLDTYSLFVEWLGQQIEV